MEVYKKVIVRRKEVISKTSNQLSRWLNYEDIEVSIVQKVRMKKALKTVSEIG